MFDISRAPTTTDLAGGHTLVVLWEPTRLTSSAMPDATGNAALARLRGLGRVRVLLRARDAMDVVAGETAHRAGLPVHVILDEGVDAPTWGAERTVVLPRTDEADELALALSDAVLVLPGVELGALAERALSLGKDVITPEAGPARALLGSGALDDGMDPDTGWHRWVLRWVGRTERMLIELCALRRQEDKANRSQQTYGQSRAKLRGCFGWKWTVESHFAYGWQALCMDRTQTPQAALVQSFDHFDRRATFGASGHRDIIWLGHLLAAVTVFAAVAGSIQERSSTKVSWTVFELTLLLLIGLMTLKVVRGRVQARWMAYRFAAEQLRIARMCLPLLVVPPLLARPDRDTLIAGTGAGRETEGSAIAAGMDEAVAAAKRIVRDHGLPALSVQPQAGPAAS